MGLYMKKHTLLIIGLLGIIGVVKAATNTIDEIRDYGLRFNSYSVTEPERTSLFLDNYEPYAFKDELKVEFDLLIRPETLFGHVLTACTDAGKYVYQSVAVEGNKYYPTLVIEEQLHELASEIKLNEWHKVSITFQKKNNTIIADYDGKASKITYPLESVKTLQLFFGRRQDVVGEIVPIDLRDVKIEKDGKPFRHWKLKQHDPDICYDELAHAPATVINPHWLLDEHQEWNTVFTATGKDLLGATFDPKSSIFYLISRNGIQAFNPQNEQESALPVKGGYPAMEAISYFSFDTLSNEIVSYNLAKQTISSYSFDTNTWSATENNSEKQPAHINHSRIYCEEDSSFYMFGGYGFYRFHNDLYRLKPSVGKLEQLKYTPAIPPRTFAAAGIVGKTLYVFGGRGNESGRQEVRAHGYADLYVIDLNTGTSRKVWTLSEEIAPNMSMSGNMYYSQEDSAFYAAIFAYDQRIVKVSLKDSTCTMISGAINNRVDCLENDMQICFSPATQRVFAVIAKTLRDKSRGIYIYSINLPLLSQSEIRQTAEPEKTGSSVGRGGYLAVAMVMLVLLAGAVLFYYRKKRSGSMRMPVDADGLTIKNDVSTDKNAVAEAVLMKKEERTPEKGETFRLEYKATKTFDREKSAISLLGSFNVWDKEGKNITSKFTPRLKKLLIVLILYGQKNKQGILIKKLDELLWGDKNDSSVRNNRNVSLSELRVLICEIGTIEVINDGGFLRIELGDDVFCDYITACKLINDFRESKEGQTEEMIPVILEVLLYGTLLPNTVIDWLDGFKADYSTLVIDLLNDLLIREEEMKNYKLASSIADVMFLHDSLSEEALHAKCRYLCMVGKKSLAKKIYDRFAKDYREILGEEYKSSFQSLIN